MNKYHEEKRIKRIIVYLYDTNNRNLGLGEFEHQLACKLASRAAGLKEHHNVELCFIVGKGMEGSYGSSVEYLGIDKHTIRILNSPLAPIMARRIMPRADLVHLTHQGARLRKALAPKTIVTIHDINFVHNHNSRFALWRKRRRFLRGIRVATHLSFISEFSRDDVLSHFHLSAPNRVIVNGVADLRPLARESERLLPPRFLFHVSRLAPKKNVHLLVEMMQYLPQYHLLIAGKGHKDYMDRLNSIIEKLRLSNVTLLGNISEAEKATFYSRCEAFLFPSLSEGFGLPPVEAMTFGKPVFLSRLTSLPEVGGTAATYFDTLQPRQMALVVERGMADYNQNRVERQRELCRQAAKFDWDKTADEYINYYLNILGLS